MPYVRPTIKYAYNCPNCDTWFIEGSFGCGIIHMAGDCCHYGEQKLAVKILGMVGAGGELVDSDSRITREKSS